MVDTGQRSTLRKANCTFARIVGLSANGTRSLFVAHPETLEVNPNVMEVFFSTFDFGGDAAFVLTRRTHLLGQTACCMQHYLLKHVPSRVGVGSITSS